MLLEMVMLAKWSPCWHVGPTLTTPSTIYYTLFVGMVTWRQWRHLLRLEQTLGDGMLGAGLHFIVQPGGVVRRCWFTWSGIASAVLVSSFPFTNGCYITPPANYSNFSYCKCFYGTVISVWNVYRIQGFDFLILMMSWLCTRTIHSDTLRAWFIWMDI